MEKYCYNCMNVKNSEGVCEHCGKEAVTDSFAHHLPLGTILNNRYMVGHVIGEGGFGITYIGRDLNLDMIVAVKEYYPTGYANRNNTVSSEVTVSGQNNKDFFGKGKTKFIHEARVLAKFSGNKSIVDVRDYFEDNNTAYIVMEYVDGITLKDYIYKYGRFEASDLINRMIPLCEALKKVHDNKLIHRDISPDNIMIMRDGSLKLMDFGAARDVNFEDKKSLSIMLKPGYAPEEQYRSKGIQGPWTDIYAICATIYKCITGVTPDESMNRVFSDELKRPSELGIEISARYEDAIMKGMALYKKDRFQNINELLAALAVSPSGGINNISINTATVSPVTEKRPYVDNNKTEYGETFNEVQGNTPNVSADNSTSTQPESITQKTNTKKKSKKKIMLISIIAGAVVVIGAVIGIILFNSVKYVPNVVGCSEAQAIAILNDSGIPYTITYQHSGTNTDSVISQNPQAGTEANEQTTITIVVS